MNSRIGSSFLIDIFEAIAERGRSLVNRGRNDRSIRDLGLAELCELLLAGRGEASGLALAQELIARWEASEPARRLEFLQILAERFGPEAAHLDAAIDRYLSDRDAASAAALHEAAEPRRQELIRRMNMAPGAMTSLVAMREEVLRLLNGHPELEAVNADFEHLLSSWFNRGFLVLRHIDWSTPANILEKIIRYEAVHEIRSWEDLRRRLAPADRRCFAFFHPRLVDEPLIFVEVALMRDIPASITEVLAEDRDRVIPSEATTAVFYSISNCCDGLRGISFGNFLLKQVIEDLKQELPGLSQYVTLSPAPLFAAWLRSNQIPFPSLDATRQRALALLAGEAWPDNPVAFETLRAILPPVAAFYFTQARNEAGQPVDPVARFHLGNGARLERINFLGDGSIKGLANSHGLMVNYLYKLDDVEKNHELFVSKAEVVTSRAVRRLLGDNAAAVTASSDTRSYRQMPREPAA
jgi:malonyl-CoA decarboxylase